MSWSNADATRQLPRDAAQRMLRQLLKKQMPPPRVMITDTLARDGAAKRDVMPGAEHRQHKGSPAQGAEQPSGEFAPAEAPTRVANQAVQICRPRRVVPFSGRPHSYTVS